MMFHEVRLPDNIAFGMKGGPRYITDIIDNYNNNEYRNIRKSQALSKYKVSFKLQNYKKIQNLLNFFRERKGKAYGFRFKDLFDYKATKQLIAVADGEQKIFQLLKNYGNEKRYIYKAVKNTVKIMINDIMQDVEIDYNTGKITFIKAPNKGDKIYADFEFDVPVRFNTDEFDASIIDVNNFSWLDVELVEIKL
jgi:uncharacterized protein (TIGR02217 family)